MQRSSVCIVLVIIVCSINYTAAGAELPSQQSQRDAFGEPSAELANLWWPPLQNVWTPIGWKDHLFRFNVIYNGTIVAVPHPRGGKKHTNKYSGQGVMLTVNPSIGDRLPPDPGSEPFQLRDTDDEGLGNQGWVDRAAPVLWTEWKWNLKGLILREEIFGHITSGKAVETGNEPLYAWIKLKVEHVDEIESANEAKFIIHLGADNSIVRAMPQHRNLRFYPDRRFYPRVIEAESFSTGKGNGIRLTEQDGLIRLVGLPNDKVNYEFKQRKDKDNPSLLDYFLLVTLPAVKDAEAILLLPMLPGSNEDVQAEINVGIDEALRQADRYWSYKPRTAAVVDTPEKQVNEAIKHSLKLAEIVAEKNPETGEYSFLSGSWQYDALWSTSASMKSHMFLDVLGYYEVVEKHIDIYYNHQGTIKPPGDSYTLHPGYFGSPKSLTSIDWLCDHGAILYLLSNHALLSGDKQFIDKWLGHIIRGCEFIKDARAIEDHDGYKGILPPGVATDRREPIQSVWTDGWNYKGLITSVRLLKLLNHPRSKEFEREAEDYKKSFVKAIRVAAKQMPEWTDSQGKKRPVVPHSLSMGADITHPFYLDTGPLILVWAELMRADDELMKTAAAYFREGPNIKLHDPKRSWGGQRPVLVHEISYCEPHYSWNIYHSWQLGDRYRFLEGLYSILVGAISPQTFASCETRHGIFGRVCAAPVLATAVRLAVIDDVLKEDELHLLRLVPKAWIKSDYLTRFENMPTKFGPVTIYFKLDKAGTALNVTYLPKFRYQPKKVLLHVPPIQKLSRIVVNGTRIEMAPGKFINIAELSINKSNLKR